MHVNDIPNDPALAIDSTFGRLYVNPDHVEDVDDLKRDIRGAIEAHLLVPSITNVLNVRNKPFLVDWAAKKAATEAVQMFTKYPDATVARPEACIAYSKDAANRDRDKAAEIGSHVHKAAEMVAKGHGVPDGLSPQEVFYLNKYEQFARDFQPEYHEVEATFFGEDYAGTADFVASILGNTVIGDYKTTRSGLHIDLALQLAALASAPALVKDGTLVENEYDFVCGIGVHLSPNAYKVSKVPFGESLDELVEVFQGLRAVWNFHVFDGNLTSGPCIGSPVSGPANLF